MFETDDTIAIAILAAGYRVLTPDGVQRRYRAAPIDALAEPKSASVRLISCVHSSPERTGKPFIVIGGSAATARHDYRGDPLLPEVDAKVASPVACWMQGLIIHLWPQSSCSATMLGWRKAVEEYDA